MLLFNVLTIILIISYFQFNRWCNQNECIPWYRALPGQRGYGVRNQGSSFGARKRGAGNQSYGLANAILGSDIPLPQAPKSPGVRQPSGFDPAAGKSTFEERILSFWRMKLIVIITQ